MTVAELIQELQKQPPQAEVRIVYDSGYAGCGISQVYVAAEDQSWFVKAGQAVIRTNQ